MPLSLTVGSEGEGEPSQEIAQELINDFDAADTNSNGALSFAEASAIVAALTQAEFNTLDVNRNAELPRSELEATGATPPRAGGCNSKSTKTLTDLKDFFGDLFLLALLTLTLIAWRGTRLSP